MPICQFIVSFKIFITCFVKELVKKPIMRNRISTQLSEEQIQIDKEILFNSKLKSLVFHQSQKKLYDRSKWATELDKGSNAVTRMLLHWDLKDLNPNRYRKEVVNLGGF